MNLAKTPLPDHSPVRAILPLCLALLLMAVASSPASQIFRYREQTGGDSFTFTWRADREQGQRDGDRDPESRERDLQQ